MEKTFFVLFTQLVIRHILTYSIRHTEENEIASCLNKGKKQVKRYGFFLTNKTELFTY